jgi:hypothetical protein
MYKYLVLVLVTLSCMSKNEKAMRKLSKAQADTMSHPYWIAMMQDTNAHFNQTVSAFELYWKNKPRPVRDSDNEGKNIYSNEDSVTQQNLEFVFEFKQFLHWKQTHKDLVKEDGHIMTPHEIQEMLKKIRE